MEATALSVGKSVLSGALGYAKSATAEEVALQLGVQKDQAFIADELEMMQSFMMEAHEERDNNKVVKTWVKQVRDTAYDVEDSLQDFAIRVQRPSWWRLRRKLLERRRVAKKMKDLRAKVEDVSKRNVRYRLIKGSGSKAAAAEQSSTIAAAIFGVDDARRAAKDENQRVDLVQLINKEDDELRVIAVWGTGGDIGQTSMIRAAYKNSDIQSKFPSRAWVRVTHPFSSEGFVRSLVNQFLAVEGFKDIMDREKTASDLVQEFDGYVKEKFLIVLTDLCTIEEWDQIEKCLPNKKKGSRIIVSTTQVEVASLCAGQDSQASELKQLSADHTLYAFYDKGSQNEMVSMDPISSSDVVTTSTNAQTVAPSEITEVQCKDVDETKVDKKSLTHIRTGVGSLEESQLIGREKEISKIVELMLNKASQQSQVISIWGMGGLGKTTLVHGIYQSPKLSDMFEKRAFVTIMRPFNPADLLRSLVGRLQEESSTKEELLNSRTSKTESLAMMGFEALNKELKRLLEMKSCLLVLDDLSSFEEWDHIVQGFSWMEKTTQIIVTTREESIAKHCSGKYGIVHNLEVLKEEDALNLFSLKVFGKAEDFVKQNPEYVEEANQNLKKFGGRPLVKPTDLIEKNPELVEERKKILKKCGGLPLAIVTIGGYLASRPKTRAEWRKLNENISAELEMNPELGMIRTVLQTSYDGLPYELKSCFLYLSIFPEDHIISQRHLVRRWIAEGYAQERHGKSATVMAENYFTELKKRSMILPFQQSVFSRKSTDSCKVHDLIRDIAISKSTEESLVFQLEEGCGLSTHGAIRHLAISSNWKGDQSEFESIVDLSRIRSLTVFGNFRAFYISDKMRLLRVLDLQRIDEDLEYHQLDHIWKLLHLKYLSLRGCYGIVLLPDSLSNLRQLQVLDVRDTRVTSLPKTIIKLRKLQYIHAGQKSDYVTEEMDSLTRRCLSGMGQCATCCVPLLWSIYGPLHKALTRRDACTFACCVRFSAFMTGVDEERGALVPRGTRKLKDLRTLRDVNVGRGNAVLQDIKMLTGLRKLGVVGINWKNGLAFREAISSLSMLESLSVSSAGERGLRGCLDGISSPPENLQSLKLYGNLEKLPEWIKELPHLVKLKLAGTRLSEHDSAMEFLGQLPKLEILVLSQVWSLFPRGEELDFNFPQAGIAFGSLRVLSFELIRKVKSVNFEQGAMPKLERLQVTGGANNEICFSGLDILQSINEVQLSVGFFWDLDRIHAARDPGTRDKTYEEERQEERRKIGELKKKTQDQLARNKNEPILMVD